MPSPSQPIDAPTDGLGPVPEDNLPGHHPDVEQDKPTGPPRSRPSTSTPSPSPTEVTRFEATVRDLTFDGFQCGPDDGELALLLHGFPQTAHAWMDVATDLAGRGFHVVAPNQRGYSVGARPRHVNAYRLHHLVSDVFDIASHLGHERAHLVGHDWGGMVAWAAAAGRPRQVETLTVVSTPHPRALLQSWPRSLQALRSSYIALFATPVVPERLLASRAATRTSARR